MKLILASNSPRRRELLSQLNYPFEAISPDCDEQDDATTPENLVKDLAFRKAMTVHVDHRDDAIIGCDTVVDLDGEVLGKPKDRQDAVNMLTRLSGRTHKVHTGLFVICGVRMWLLCETTSVTFRPLTTDEITAYVNSGSPMDKAGAYGIQDTDFVTNIDGSYNNVMGLPTERLKKILESVMR